MLKRYAQKSLCLLLAAAMLIGVGGLATNFVAFAEETQAQTAHYIAVFLIDGDFYDTTMAPVGDPILLPPDPQGLEGFTFSGWTDLPAAMPVGGVNINGHFRPRALDRIAVTTLPYAGGSAINGLPFNPDGMVLTLYYDNDTTRTLAVTNAMIDNGTVTVSPAWFTQTGQQEITLTYNNKSTTVTVTVVERSVLSVAVASPPSKTVYTKGEALALAGGEVRVNFDNTTQAVLPMTNAAVKVTGYNAQKVGEQTLTVTYTDSKGKTHTTSFKVSVNDKPQYAKGDVNNRDGINALDLLLIQRHILGIQRLTGPALDAADVNNRDGVNALDLLIIQRHILGIEKIKP